MTQKYKYTFNARNDDDDDVDYPQMTVPDKKPYQHYEHTYTVQHIHFYLSESIGAPNKYTDMIHRINSATENDTVFIHLNTPGGRLDTGVQIINAMQNSAAHVVTILESEAHSLGTLIFLAGDELVVNDHVMIMFHNFKGGFGGKGHEAIAQLDATVKWFAELARELYIPFLSEDEFDRIIRGEDLWMHSVEIRERIEHMIKVYENENREASIRGAADNAQLIKQMKKNSESSNKKTTKK